MIKPLAAAFSFFIAAFSGYAQQPVKLLIVYPDSLAPALYDYQKFREANGVETVLLPLSAAGKFPNEHELKRVLQQTRKSFEFNHLLLAGSLYHIPMYEYAGNTFSDHFYALLDADSLPDVALGRLPVNSQAEMRQYMAKAEKAERALQKKRASLVVQGSSTSDDRMARRAREWFAGNGYRNNLYSRSSGQALPALLSDTTLALVFQIGLGTAPGWMDVPQPFTSHQAAQLDAAIVHTIISVACSTAGPQYREALARAVVFNPDGGALTYIGCTGNCLVKWADELGLSVLQAIPSAQTIGNAFLMGQLGYRQAFYSQHPFETSHSLEQFILIGDPSLAVGVPGK